MAKFRFTITMSVDGYVAGPRQSLENPLGEGGVALHDWAFATRSFRATHGGDGGETGLDDDHAARWNENIGATVMGRNMFGPVRGSWGDDTWKGDPRGSPLPQRRLTTVREPRRRPVGVRVHRSRQLSRRGSLHIRPEELSRVQLYGR